MSDQKHPDPQPPTTINYRRVIWYIFWAHVLVFGWIGVSNMIWH